MSAHLVTTLGEITSGEVGWMLAHEHVFVNLYADDDCGAQADQVVARMTPLLRDMQANGASVLVEATALGGARRPDILQAVSAASGVPIIAATGVFKEPAKTALADQMGEPRLRAWMIRELTEQIEGSTFRAGWIKLSVADSGITPHEAILIRAAAAASTITGAVVGVHTVGAPLANAVLDAFEASGGSPDRLIWIHTQTEPEIDKHAVFARRGAWIEYDAIDEDRPDEAYCKMIVRALDGGYGDHVLLSHDRSGYDPRRPDGATIKPYTHLMTEFVGRLEREYGADAHTVAMLLHDNPFRAYARP